EERLDRAEAGHVGEDLTDQLLGLLDGSDRSGQAVTVVLGEDLERRAADAVGVGARVDAELAHQVAHTVGESRRHMFHPPMALPETGCARNPARKSVCCEESSHLELWATCRELLVCRRQKRRPSRPTTDDSSAAMGFCGG